MISRRAVFALLFGSMVLAVGPVDTEEPASLLPACLLFFGLLVAAGIGFPIPEELPIILAGIWVGHNSELGPARWILLPVCILGVVISDGLLYGIGRFFGPRLLEYRWVKRILPPKKRQHIEDNFHKYGVWTLLFARFLPAIRSPIFITAGIMRLPLTRFLLADGLYAIPGVSMLFGLAFWFGDQFKDLVMAAERRVAPIRPLIILLVIAGIAGFLLYHFVRRPMASGDPEELPIVGEKMASKIELSLSRLEHPDVPKAETAAPQADHHPPATNVQEIKK